MEARVVERGKWVKARKDHICSLCGGPIHKGTTYKADTFTPWDHEVNEGFFSYKAHRQCHAFFEEMWGPMFNYELPGCRSEWVEEGGPVIGMQEGGET